jgi:cobalt-zinc-cadmium efflux system protein
MTQNGSFGPNVEIDSFHIVLDSIDIDEVKKRLLHLPGVVSIHDLHVWSLSTTEAALTAIW